MSSPVVKAGLFFFISWRYRMLLLIILYFVLFRAFYRLAPGRSNTGRRLAVSAWVVFVVWESISLAVFFGVLEAIQPGSFRKVPGYITGTAPFLIGLLITGIYYQTLKRALRTGRGSYWVM